MRPGRALSGGHLRAGLLAERSLPWEPDLLRERVAAAERLSGFEARLGERNSEAAAATAALADARQALKAFDRAEAVREKPLSIFVSAKTETVEIRQGFTVIHEAPVTIAANGARLGTHVLTAVANSGTAAKPKLTWSVVSLGGGGLVAPTPAQGKARELRRGRVREEVSRVLNAEAALAAVTFAQPTRDLIEELIRPGASLTLSDLAPSRETGLYTDVILATR